MSMCVHVCLYVCTYVCTYVQEVMQVPVEAKSGRWIPWNQSYIQVVSELGTEPMSSARAVQDGDC